MTFNLTQVQDAVETNFNVDCIDHFKECLICDFDDEVAPRVRVILTAEWDYRSTQGIHLHNIENESDLIFEIGRALNECFRSGFTNIWIHQGGAQ